MTREDYKKIDQVRIEIVEEGGTYSYPIHCPHWLLTLLEKLEY